MSERVREYVLSIIKTLESGVDCDGEDIDTYDYLEDVLDFEWILNSDATLKGARVLVAFGGPNIWINTVDNTVEGYWWNDNFTASYTDEIGFNEAVQEIAACTLDKIKIDR